MYLSKLTLNPHNRQVQREVGNPYQLHRTLMQGFPETLAADERVLFRLDADARTGSLHVLVQSIHEPDWSTLREAGQGRYLVSPPEPAKHFAPSLSAGSILHFRLRANPTIKKRREDKKNSNRVPLIREEEQQAWLGRKGELHGFRVLQSTISGDEKLTDRIQRDDKTHKLDLYTVQFDGVLQVTDADLFAQALAQGIGPARGFGCGLLSLARSA